MSLKGNNSRNPWLWIPTVYISEGLPYFAVNSLTVLMYVNMGISISEMAFYTGWLYLPWVIKPFWSPFVDILKTNRWWMLLMQLLIGIAFAAVAFLLPTSFFFSSTLFVFWLMAFFSATFDIAADGFYIIALSPHSQAAFVGVRSTFYRIASVIGQGGLVILAGVLEKKLGDISLAWAYVFYGLSLLFLILTLYHLWALPKPDRNAGNVKKARSFITDFFSTFYTFFKKKHIITALAFILLYRLPEALCLKIVQPFLVTSRSQGGLGLTISETGLINGTFGVVALLAGGIIGGLAIARGGLKKWLWPMALSLTVPCLFYCFLAMYQPESYFIISAAISVEQFGYGFGFSAYMLYLLYFSRGENSTSHYAFCTAFMALGMMLPGMAAGWLFDKCGSFDVFVSGNLLSSSGNGFSGFFWLVMLFCLPSLFVTSRLKVDPSFGKKQDH